MELRFALLAEIIRQMEAKRQSIGVGQHLLVQELLQKLPSDIDVVRLKTLLAPIFSANAQEQEDFYNLFDKSWANIQRIDKEKDEEEEELPEVSEERQWRIFFILLSIIVATSFIAIFRQASGVEGPKDDFREIPIQLFRNDTVVLQNEIPFREDTLRTFTFGSGEKLEIDSIWGTYKIDEANRIEIITNDTIGDTIDIVIIKAIYDSGQDSLHFLLTITEKPVIEEQPEPTEPKPQLARLKPKEIPYPHDLPRPNLDALRNQNYWDANKWWIKPLLIGLIGLLLWVLIIWFERKRKKDIAEIQETHDGPPYLWEVELEAPEELAIGLQAKKLSSKFRKRRLEDYHEINIPQTIEATTRNAGLVQLRYSQPSRPSEYLLLIDRHAIQDHRALLFDDLYEAFKEEEVYIARFFYDGNPKVLFNEVYPNGLKLKEIQHKYSNARLLILGDGRTFFNPVTGDWAKWTTELMSWKARGLLTPQPVESWGLDEELLAKRFFLLPASLKGIDKLLEQFELVEPKPWEETIKLIDDSIKDPIYLQEELIPTLNYYFSKPMVNWIAACAVYPQLQWKITLHLGKEFSTEKHNLLSIDNILQLVRLPWFVDGRMPDLARAVLINYLKKQGLEVQVRQIIQQLLEKAEPPTQESVAYEKWRVNKLFNDWKLATTPRENRKLKTEIQRYIAAGFSPDKVTQNELEVRHIPKQANLSDRLKQLLFVDGEYALGWRNSIWATTLWTLLSALILFFNPTYNICDGELIQSGNEVVCLSTAADSVLYFDYLSRKMIQEGRDPDSTHVITAQVYNYPNLLTIYDPSSEESYQGIGLKDRLFLKLPSSLLEASLLQNISNPNESFQNLAQEFKDSLEVINRRGVDERIRAVGDQLIENVAIAWYNRGVKSFNKYLSYKEANPEDNTQADLNPFRGNQVSLSALDSLAILRDEAAFHFLIAEQFKTSVPEIYNALRSVYGEEKEKKLPELVSGTVYDQNNKPLAAVEINIDTFNFITNAKGKYEIPIRAALELDVLNLTYSKDGFLPQEYTFTLIDENATDIPDIILEQIDKRTNRGLEIFTLAGRDGLRTTDGQTVVDPIYNRIELDGQTGFYRVQVNNAQGDLRFGYLDQNGRVRLPAEYYELGFFSEGLMKVQKRSYVGYMDVNWRLVIDTIFYDGSYFKDGQARVTYNTPFTNQRDNFLIDKNGKCIAECPFGETLNQVLQLSCNLNQTEDDLNRIASNFNEADLFILFAVLLDDNEELTSSLDFIDLPALCAGTSRDETFFYYLLYIVDKNLDKLSATALENIKRSKFGEVFEGGDYSDIGNTQVAQLTIRIMKSIAQKLGYDIPEKNRVLPPPPQGSITKIVNWKDKEILSNIYFDVDNNNYNTDLRKMTADYITTINDKGGLPTVGLQNQMNRLDALCSEFQNLDGTNIKLDIELRVYVGPDENLKLRNKIVQQRGEIVKTYLSNCTSKLIGRTGEQVNLRVVEMFTDVNTNQQDQGSDPYSMSKILGRRVEVVFNLLGSEGFTQQAPTQDHIERFENEFGVYYLKWQIEKGHTSSVYAVAFSPNGQYLATASDDNTAKLWELNTGTEILSFESHSSSVYAVAFSPNGQFLATASSDQTAKLWDLKGNVLQTFNGHTDYIRSVAFSPDGQSLATASADQTAILWDLRGNVLQTFKGHTAYVRSVAFSPNGQYLATTSLDQTAKLWDLKGNVLQTFSGHTGDVSSLAFSPNGQYLATTSYDDTAKLWEVNTGAEILSFKGHTSGIYSLAISPNGQYLATTSYDQTVKLWRISNGQELYSFNRGNGESIYGIAFSPDGKSIAFANQGGSIYLYEIELK